VTTARVSGRLENGGRAAEFGVDSGRQRTSQLETDALLSHGSAGSQDQA